MTSEQDFLIKKAEDSLRAAKLLLDQGFYNFSVSRSYYTMFYIAEAFLLGEGLSYSKHSGVIAAFGKIFAKTKKIPVEFHRYLIDAENSRNVGDYDIRVNLLKDDALEQIERAEKFLDLAGKMIF